MLKNLGKRICVLLTAMAVVIAMTGCSNLMEVSINVVTGVKAGNVRIIKFKIK